MSRERYRFAPRVSGLLAFALVVFAFSDGFAQWMDPAQHEVRVREHGQRVIPADMDNDGDIDLICSYSLTDEVILELNNGDGTAWTQVSIATGIVAMFAVPLDVDGDNDLDIAVVELFDRNLGFNTQGRVVWYEQPANITSSWTYHPIDVPPASLIHMRYLDAGDIDGDGDPDLAAVSSIDPGGAVVWYENRRGEPAPAWTRWTVASGLNQPESVRLTDIRGDGTLDMVVAELVGYRVLWFANENNPKRNNWTERSIGTAAGGPSSARPYDMDGDGDSDVVVAAQDAGQLVWFERPADVLGAASWMPHAIADLFGATELVRADFNDDGLLDFGSGSFDLGTFDILENDGAGGYILHSYNYPSFVSVEAADIDGDGDQDALTASYVGNRVDWWENLHGGSCLLSDDLVLTDQLVNATQAFEACDSITAGPNFLVAPPGNVTLRARNRVILRNGFSVISDAELTIEIDPFVGSP